MFTLSARTLSIYSKYLDTKYLPYVFRHKVFILSIQSLSIYPKDSAATDSP